MRIILSRHGNTFAAEDKIVWVGRKTDLPLTAEGCQQAHRLASALREANVHLSAIYCGPLQRTRLYADIVRQCSASAPEPIVDQRLVEIDYGLWEGLTNQEIVEKHGPDALHAWEKKNIWPATVGWQPGEADVSDNVFEFADDLVRSHGEQDTVLAITSNGILRYFLHLVAGALHAHTASGRVKVSTGNICIIEFLHGRYHLSGWNFLPTGLALRRSDQNHMPFSSRV